MAPCGFWLIKLISVTIFIIKLIHSGGIEFSVSAALISIGTFGTFNSAFAFILSFHPGSPKIILLPPYHHLVLMPSETRSTATTKITSETMSTKLNPGEEILEPIDTGTGKDEKPDQEKEPKEEDDENESHHDTPKRGRPGIVVFSGGTAFNAAAAEMASRDVGIPGTSADGRVSRSNSLSSLGGLGGLVTAWSLEDEESKVAGTNRSSIATTSPSGNVGGTKVWHVLPVTDDGGSTAEIVRILGGPAVGDIRSRLLRLAPGTTSEARAVRRLLGHRLVSMGSLRKGKKENYAKGEEPTPEKVSRMAREEWLWILDGGQEPYKQALGLDDGGDQSQDDFEHPLWKPISAPYRSIIRSFLLHFHTQVLQNHNGLRHSSSNPPFDFTGGSIGNFFFAGARRFFGSLPAAIFLFSKVAGIPSGSRVIPAVLTEERLVLGAELKDGTRIRGQYAISHPHPKVKSTNAQEQKHRAVVKCSIDSKEAISSLHSSPMSRVAYLLHDPTWRRQSQFNTERNKDKIKPEWRRKSQAVWAVKNNEMIPVSTSCAAPQSLEPILEWNDRHEIHPAPNPNVIEAINNANCIVFGCGSLFTSVLPSLVLEGVGDAISRVDEKFNGDARVPRVLLLNGWHDKETSWAESCDGELLVKKMDATGIVRAVVDALDQGGIHAGCNSKIDFVEDNVKDQNGSVSFDIDFSPGPRDSIDSSPLPLITDYVTHILYPFGTEINIDEDSLLKFCRSRKELRDRMMKKLHPTHEQPTPSKSNSTGSLGSNTDRIVVIGVESIPANTCAEGSKSGGQSKHHVFDSRALVDTLLDLARGGNGETI